MNINPNAKVILCYGDSNTWGAIPITIKRYPSDIRWPGVLQDILSNEYEIISEGLCGRTFVANNPEKLRHTGITHLEVILRSQRPFDFMTIMLGTNDVQTIYNLKAKDIAEHLEQTINFIKDKLKEFGQLPEILVICPPAVTKPKNSELVEEMIPGVEIFKELPTLFREVSIKNNCHFLNAGDFISLEDTDGYHLSAEHHNKLGKKVAEKIKEISSNHPTL